MTQQLGPLEAAILHGNQIVIKQRKELTEIFFGIETKNRYFIFDQTGTLCGNITERGGGVFGFLKRVFLKSHRPFQIDVSDAADKQVLFFSRRFFFFFSDIEVFTPIGNKIGSAHRRFGIFHKLYDLKDAQGKTFARVKTGIWRIWTLNILDHSEREKARITKKWGGVLKEMFTEADNFLIEFLDGTLPPDQRAVVFAMAISADFDFFSHSRGSGQVVDLLDG